MQKASEARFDFPSIPLKNANCYASREISGDSFNTIIAKAGSKGCIILELLANADMSRRGKYFIYYFSGLSPTCFVYTVDCLLSCWTA